MRGPKKSASWVSQTAETTEAAISVALYLVFSDPGIAWVPGPGRAIGHAPLLQYSMS